MKTSPYKDKIIQLFKKAPTLSIAQIRTKMPSADFSTIFRNVEKLVKEGVLKKIIVDKDVTVYAQKGAQSPQHHFICLECGQVENVQISANILKSSRVKVTDVILRGICEACNS
ncbi:MAG: hypothetical protein RJB39_169 [Candidatus Parcubacteria bacterium]|jgi:Fe2+ or Zn2+ uptake regulation protein